MARLRRRSVQFIPQQVTTSMTQGSKQGATAAANGKQLSKMECVRRVIKKMGIDVKPLEIQDRLKKKYQLDMSTSVISTYKNNVKKELKSKGGHPKKQKGRSTSPAGAISEITLQDIQAVKTLVDRIGAQKLRELAGVFAK